MEGKIIEECHMQDTSTIKSNSIIIRPCNEVPIIAITSQIGLTAVRRFLAHFAFCSVRNCHLKT
jgi:hypothetical protein